MLGAWLLIAPFVLGFVGLAAASANAFVVGALVIVLAATALYRMGRSGTASGTAHRGA